MSAETMSNSNDLQQEFLDPFETTGVMREEHRAASERQAERVWSIMQDHNPDALVAFDYSAAFVGVAHRCGQPSLAVYSVSKCIDALMKRDGMTYEEAAEFFEFNVAGAWLGEGTPVWLYTEEEE